MERAWLQRKLAQVAGALQLGAADVSFVVVADATMSRLHEQHLGMAGPTDVLSFDLRQAGGDGAQPGTAEAVEGEVYVCFDEAQRQAGQRGHPVSHELLLYAVHGLLHLIGYDDREPAGHRAMHRKEDELLSAIGVGPVYAEEGEPA